MGYQFFMGLLNQLRRDYECPCQGSNCPGWFIVMTDEGIAPEQYEMYMNALENCGISPERQNQLFEFRLRLLYWIYRMNMNNQKAFIF
jgi:hypothetical protein